MSIEQLVLELFEIGAIQFGSFTLKSGQISPIYLDLRRAVSKPKLLTAIGEHLHKAANAPCDLICGVPYTALPFATVMSIAYNIPMVMRRKEQKQYGTKKIIEGIYNVNDRCLIVEDLITSGSSILETAVPLRAEKLIVTHAVVLIDREQGGKRNIAQEGLQLHAVCTLRDVLTILVKHEKLARRIADDTANQLQLCS